MATPRKRYAPRKDLMKALADNMDMSYEPIDDYGIMNLLSDFALFNIGKRRKITNVIRKTDAFLDLDVRIFDYQYQRGKKSRVMRQNVFFVKSTTLGIPELLIKPETIFHKVANYFGMQDIDFEEFPDFSNQYLVQGPDEERIRSVLSNKVLKYFTVEKDWNIEGLNYYMIFYKSGRLLRTSQIRNFYNKGLAVHDMLKSESLIP